MHIILSIYDVQTRKVSFPTKSTTPNDFPIDIYNMSRNFQNGIAELPILTYFYTNGLIACNILINLSVDFLKIVATSAYKLNDRVNYMLLNLYKMLC